MNIILVMGFLILLFVTETSGQVKNARTDLRGANLNYILQESWEAYKEKFVQDDGRVIDWSAQQMTTSEGQSYALLRSVWTNDRSFYDKVLRWTENNLQVKTSKLFAWKWGRTKEGRWGVLDDQSATDADQDIALSLILAFNRWGDSKYKTKAFGILHDIWEKETTVINKRRVVVPGDWVKGEQGKVLLNPSHFSPYAYRLFANIDPEHDWHTLVSDSYQQLNDCTARSKVMIPPDQCWVDIQTGEVLGPRNLTDRTFDHSYDAMRVLWRVALDFEWFREERARDYLEKCSFLIHYWQLQGRILDGYTPEGIPRSKQEHLSFYGSYLPAFKILNPSVSEELYQIKIKGRYKDGFWGNQNNYYSQNWVWFGIALTNSSISNFGY